jgi:hypothetical protein
MRQNLRFFQEYYSNRAWQENQINANKSMISYCSNCREQRIEFYCILIDIEFFHGYTFHLMML